MWLAGNIADVQVVQQFALIGLLEAAVWTFLGIEIVRLLAFPLLFLFFCVPAGESLVPPLQRLTAVFTVNALRLSGIPSVQDGLLISTPSGDWKIAEACSGIRYLTSSVVVGVLVAGVAFRTWKRRFLFVLLSAIVPILANALRAYLIVVLAYVSNNRIATGIDHVIYGWIFFSLVTAVLIGVALAWHKAEDLDPEPSKAYAPRLGPTRSANPLWYMAVLVMIAVIVISTSNFVWSRIPDDPAPHTWSAPGGWLSTFDPDRDWTPDLTSISFQSYSKGAVTVSLYVASSSRNGRGVELINSSNAVGTSGLWQVVNGDYRTAIIAGRPATIAEYLITSGSQHRLVWIWYVSGSEVAAKPSQVKWIQAKSRLIGHSGPTLLFAISTPFVTGHRKLLRTSATLRVECPYSGKGSPESGTPK